MSRVIILLLLVAAIGVGTYMGCSPQAGVAKDKIIKKLNAALGELDVARKKIEQKQAGLQKQLDELQENRYRSEARLDLLADKKKNSEVALASLKGKIDKVKDLIQEVKSSPDGKIKRGDKEYTTEDIQQTAEEVAASFKAEQVKLEGLKTSYNALNGSVDFLKNQVEKSTKLMRELNQKVSEIDAKKVAVDAVRDNTSLVGENKSISESLESMQKEIDDLGVDVEAALRIETDKMNELNSTSSKAAEILSEPSDINDTEKMLDDLLKTN